MESVLGLVETASWVCSYGVSVRAGGNSKLGM